ncbi:MAG: SDR family oxidoreductase [Planctomycetota bacterium]|jgi:NAD(P)-dependent dehydrogenase (short-subunit alcohol dehydrogenase family)
MIGEKFDLEGKVALVVGGRGFLGQRFSVALAEFGARVYAADLPNLSAAARKDTNVLSLVGIEQRPVDVTNPESVRALIQGIVDETSSIDVLVYSVTAKPHDFYLPFTECSLEGWQTLLRAELDGLFLVTQHAGRIMESARHGSIIFLASIYGVVGNDQRIYEGANLAVLYGEQSHNQPKRIYSHAGYAAAKGAIISLTRFLAAYWGEYGIRVNCISPGGIEHPQENEVFLQKYSARAPLGRKADPDEISSSVVYLASDASSYVTGHNLVVDGGWTVW